MPFGLYPYGNWEPFPHNAGWRAMLRQRRGFKERLRWPLVWTKIDWSDFPEGGVFGHDRAWCMEHEVYATCTHAGEDLVLVNLAWAGWPDPPEWGLWSRAGNDRSAQWRPWGHFALIPDAWTVPEPDDVPSSEGWGRDDDCGVDSPEYP